MLSVTLPYDIVTLFYDNYKESTNCFAYIPTTVYTAIRCMTDELAMDVTWNVNHIVKFQYLFAEK